MKEDFTKQIDDLNEDLKVRQESIDILKGRLKNQITSFKETIAKVLIETLLPGGAISGGGGEPPHKMRLA